MIEMRPAKVEELAKLRELWKETFGDTDDMLDFFFEHCASYREMLILLEDSVLRSMLALLPMSVVSPEGERISSAYVYALATVSQARGKGYAKLLLHYVDFYLKERGVECVTVVPAEESLHRFFASAGFCECFSTRETVLADAQVGPPTPNGGIVAIGAEEYGAIRTGVLKDLFCAEYPPALLELQRGLSRISGANLYRIAVDGAEGCAAAEYQEDGGLVLKELLIVPAAMERAVALVKGILPACKFRVRTPAAWERLTGGTERPFGMIKWYSGIGRAKLFGVRNGYFGLGFD